MKLWRKQAAEHNAEAEKKHQGRKNKSAGLVFPKYMSMSDLLKGLFMGVGLLTILEKTTA